MSMSVPREKCDTNPIQFAEHHFVGGSPERGCYRDLLTFRSPSMSYSPLPPMIPTGCAPLPSPCCVSYLVPRVSARKRSTCLHHQPPLLGLIPTPGLSATESPVPFEPGHLSLGKMSGVAFEQPNHFRDVISPAK